MQAILKKKEKNKKALRKDVKNKMYIIFINSNQQPN